MNQIIYLDVFFLTNFIISETLLIWLRLVTGKTSRYIRLFLGGVFGSLGTVVTQLYICTILKKYTYSGLLLQLISLFGIVFLMLWIVYGKMKSGEYKSCLLKFFLGTILYAGILMTGIPSVTMTKNVGQTNVMLSFPALCIKSNLLLLLAPICRFFFEKTIQNGKQYIPIELEKNGVVQKGIGLLDTGNCLYHPWTKQPVVVTEHRFLRPFFDEEEYEKQEKLLRYGVDCAVCKERIIWIPFCSVGKQEGLMPGMHFEHLRLQRGKSCVDYSNALVAFCKEKISVREEYQMILHSSYIE